MDDGARPLHCLHLSKLPWKKKKKKTKNLYIYMYRYRGSKRRRESR
jgi:hypothetical protein